MSSYPVLGQLYNTSATYVSIDVSQVGHGFSLLDPVYYDTDRTWKLASNARSNTLASHVVYQPTANTFIAVSKGRVKKFQHGLGMASTKLYLSNGKLATSSSGIFGQQIGVILDANHIQVSIHEFGLGEIAANLNQNELLVVNSADLSNIAQLPAPSDPKRHVLMADSSETYGVKWVANDTNAPDRIVASKSLYGVNAGDTRFITFDSSLSGAARAHVEVFEEMPGTTLTFNDPWKFCSTFEPKTYDQSSMLTASANIGDIIINAANWSTNDVGRELLENGGNGRALITEVVNEKVAKAQIKSPFASTNYTGAELVDLKCDTTKMSLTGTENAKFDAWDYQTRTYVGRSATSPVNMFIDNQQFDRGFKGIAALAYLDGGNLVFKWSINGAVSCCGVGGIAGSADSSKVWRLATVNGDGTTNPAIYDLSEPRVIIDNNSMAHIVVKGALTPGGAQQYLHLYSSVAEPIYENWTLSANTPDNSLIIAAFHDHQCIPDNRGIIHCYFTAQVGANRDVYHSKFDYVTKQWSVPTKVTRDVQTLNATITDVNSNAKLSVDVYNATIRVGFIAKNSVIGGGADFHVFVATSINYGDNYADIFQIDTTAAIGSTPTNVKVVQRNQLHVSWVGRATSDAGIDQAYYRRVSNITSGLDAVTNVSSATAAVTNVALTVSGVNVHLIYNSGGILRYTYKTINSGNAVTWTPGGAAGINGSYLFREQEFANNSMLIVRYIGDQLIVGAQSDNALLTAVNSLGSYQWRRTEHGVIIDDSAAVTSYEDFEDPHVRLYENNRHMVFVKRQTASPNYVLGYQKNSDTTSDITLHAAFAAHNQRKPLMAIEPVNSGGVNVGVNGDPTLHVVWTGLSDDDGGTAIIDESLITHLYYTNRISGTWNTNKLPITSVLATFDSIAQTTDKADFQFIAAYSKCVLLFAAVTEAGPKSRIYYTDVLSGQTTFSAPTRVDNLAYFDTRDCSTVRFVMGDNTMYAVFFCVDDTQYYIASSGDKGATWTVANTAGTPIPVFNANICIEDNLSVIYDHGLIYAAASGSSNASQAPEIYFARSNNDINWNNQKIISNTRHDNAINGPSDYLNPQLLMTGDYPLKRHLLLVYSQGTNGGAGSNPTLIYSHSPSNGSQWVTSRVPIGEFTLISSRNGLASGRGSVQLVKGESLGDIPRIYVAGKSLGSNIRQVYEAELSRTSDDMQLVPLTNVRRDLPYFMVSDRNARALSTLTYVDARYPRLHVAYADSAGLYLGHVTCDALETEATLSSIMTLAVHAYAFVDSNTQHVIIGVAAVHNSGGLLSIKYYEYDTTEDNVGSLLRYGTVYSEAVSDRVFCNKVRVVHHGANGANVIIYAEFNRPAVVISRFRFNRSLLINGNDIALPDRKLRVGWHLDDVIERSNKVFVAMHADHDVKVIDSVDDETYYDGNLGSTLSFQPTNGFSEYSLATSNNKWRIYANDQFVYAREFGTTEANLCYIFDAQLSLLTRITLTGFSLLSNGDDISASKSGRVVIAGATSFNTNRGKIDVYVANDAVAPNGSSGNIGKSTAGLFAPLVTSATASLQASVVSGDREGNALAVSDDGAVIVSGVPNANSAAGRVLLYETTLDSQGNPLWSGTITSATAILGSSALSNAQIGTNVAIGGSGSLQFVASSVSAGLLSGGAYTGQVLIWVRGASWGNLPNPTYVLDTTTAAPNTIISSTYGISTAFDYDGTAMIAVNGTNGTNNVTHVYVSSVGAGLWASNTAPTATLTAGINESQPKFNAERSRIHTFDSVNVYSYNRPISGWSGTLAPGQTVNLGLTSQGTYTANTSNIYGVNNVTSGNASRFTRHWLTRINGCISTVALASDAANVYAMSTSSEPQNGALVQLYTNAGGAGWNFTPTLVSRENKIWPEIESSSLYSDGTTLFANYQGVVGRATVGNNGWLNYGRIGKPISYGVSSNDTAMLDSINSWRLDDMIDFSAYTNGASDSRLIDSTNDHILVADGAAQQARLYKRICKRWLLVRTFNVGATITAVALNDDRLAILVAGMVYIQERALPAEWGTGGAILGGAMTTSIATGVTAPAMALSGDGSTLVIGNNTNANGGFYVYEAIGGSGGTFVGATLTHTRTGTGSLNEGQKIGVSDDGSTIIAGSTVLEGVNVFERNGTTWTASTPVATLSVGGGVNEGESAAISGDGSRIVIGDNLGNGAAGQLHIYDRNNRLWDSNAVLRQTLSLGNNEAEGVSVALNSDGSTLLTGGVANGTVARVYSLNSSNYSLDRSSVHTLLQNGATTTSSYAVSISPDGRHAACLTGGFLRIYRRYVPLIATQHESNEVGLFAQKASTNEPAMLYLDRKKYWGNHPTALTAAIDTNSVNIENWSRLTSMTSTVTENSQSLYLTFSLSNSNDRYWYVVKNGSNPRVIARQLGNAYQYNKATNYTLEDFADASAMDTQTMLINAASIVANRMTGAQLNLALTNDFPSVVGMTSMTLGVMMQTSDVFAAPVLNDLDVSFMSNVTYKLSNDYIIDLQGTTSAIITAPSSLTSSKTIKVLVVK